MKKRHQQKLVVLGIFLLIATNIPILLIFDTDVNIYGIPSVYAYIFLTWLFSIIVSYIILHKYFE